MISIWKQTAELRQIDKVEPNCWVNVTNPTPAEVQQLISDFSLQAAFVNDVLDIDERSRMELDENKVMIILRIPHAKTDQPLPYITLPLGIIITPDHVITISLMENDVINDLMNPLRTRSLNIQMKVNFVLDIILRSSIHFLKSLKEINAHTIEIDRDLKRSTQNKELYKLMRIEKCLVYFITSLKSNELLLAKLEHSKFFTTNERDEDLLEDAIIESRQASEMAKIYSDILSNMMDTIGSIINNNLNTVMKALTSITIIIMIPNLIYSFYGMNINLPIADHANAYHIILAISLILSVLGWFFLFVAEKFRFRKLRQLYRFPFGVKKKAL